MTDTINAENRQIQITAVIKDLNYFARLQKVHAESKPASLFLGKYAESLQRHVNTLTTILSSDAENARYKETKAELGQIWNDAVEIYNSENGDITQEELYQAITNLIDEVYKDEIEKDLKASHPKTYKLKEWADGVEWKRVADIAIYGALLGGGYLLGKESSEKPKDDKPAVIDKVNNQPHNSATPQPTPKKLEEDSFAHKNAAVRKVDWRKYTSTRQTESLQNGLCKA